MRRQFEEAMRVELAGARRKSWAVVVTWIAAAAICLLISINW
jgi:hypothetical protein